MNKNKTDNWNCKFSTLFQSHRQTDDDHDLIEFMTIYFQSTILPPILLKIALFVIVVLKVISFYRVPSIKSNILLTMLGDIWGTLEDWNARDPYLAIYSPNLYKCENVRKGNQILHRLNHILQRVAAFKKILYKKLIFKKLIIKI
jgi:hypothetical protein